MEFKHFEGPGFIMEVPTNWYISSSSEFQAIFLAPDMQYVVRPSLAVAVRRVQPTVTPTAVAAETRAIQEKEYPQYEVLSENDYSKTGGHAFQRLYRWANPKVGAGLLQHQTFVVVEGVLFTLTATRPLLEAEIEQQLDEIFIQMMQSFQVKLPLTLIP